MTSSGSSLKVLVTGSTGLIGSSLVQFLTTGGHEVIRLVRPQSRAGGRVARWDPARGTIDAADLEGLDAVVHLAGESIVSGRWSKSRKERIWNSRVESTRLLSETLARLDRRPRVFISASATGIYGSRGDEILSEQSEAGSGFLAELTRHWEKACDPARESNIRVVHLRTGVVLHPIGGALATMLPIFRLGLGGRIGNGRQYMSWIALDDLVLLIHHAMTEEVVSGAINAVSPRPATNREFTRALAGVLGRPALFPVPAPILRLAFGEMAEETVLTSQRIEPQRAIATGYRFRFPDLEDALRHLLGKSSKD